MLGNVCIVSMTQRVNGSNGLYSAANMPNGIAMISAVASEIEISVTVNIVLSHIPSAMIDPAARAVKTPMPQPTSRQPMIVRSRITAGHGNANSTVLIRSMPASTASSNALKTVSKLSVNQSIHFVICPPIAAPLSAAS